MSAQSTAEKLRARITEAMHATAHLRDYKTEYIDVRIVCAPGDPDIYHKTACSGKDLMALLDSWHA
jgi:hypothetical protein